MKTRPTPMALGGAGSSAAVCAGVGRLALHGRGALYMPRWAPTEARSECHQDSLDPRLFIDGLVVAGWGRRRKRVVGIFTIHEQTTLGTLVSA